MTSVMSTTAPARALSRIQLLGTRTYQFARTTPAGAVGGVLVLAMLVLAVFGPLIQPYGALDTNFNDLFRGPGGDFLLGTDFLGRDVLSRVLAGGRSVVVLAGLATVVGYVLGAAIGLVAGYSRSLVDPVLMRAMDVLLAFPPILFLLLLAAGAGASPVIVVVGIAIVQAPGIARVIRSATLEVSVKAYVEAAIARGEPTRRILRREIVPNIFSTIVADGGPRLTISILLVAGLNFLGLGLRPPAADWAVMISENRSGLSLNIWAVVAPAVLIGVLTVATNVVADAIARTRGVSVDETMMHR